MIYVSSLSPPALTNIHSLSKSKVCISFHQGSIDWAGSKNGLSYVLTFLSKDFRIIPFRRPWRVYGEDKGGIEPWDGYSQDIGSLSIESCNLSLFSFLMNSALWVRMMVLKINMVHLLLRQRWGGGNRPAGQDVIMRLMHARRATCSEFFASF